MTGYRHRYAESLTDWAELHAEPVERTTGPLTEHCAAHGDYTPSSGPDADCPRCHAEFDARDRARRHHAWTTADGADRADAHHDAHQQ